MISSDYAVSAVGSILWRQWEKDRVQKSPGTVKRQTETHRAKATIADPASSSAPASPTGNND